MLVCLIAFMNAVARTGGLFNVVPVIGAVRLGLSVAQIGAGLAAGSLIGLLAAYPAGMLADRFGRKAVIVPSTGVAGTSMLLRSEERRVGKEGVRTCRSRRSPDH